VVRRIAAYGGQAVIYALFAAVIGYLSDSPAYEHYPPDRAMLKLSFSHGGDRKGGCREPTAEELANTAPNMRRKMICPRERVPLLVELEVDGKVLFHDLLPPSGLALDGPSRVYRRFDVSAGPHRMVARLRDSEREHGFDYENRIDATLRPGQNFVIDFHADTGGFRFK